MPEPTPEKYDAILIVSFGGPEGPDDVVPFLRNVTEGRNIPDERLAVVGQHYASFGGISPINGQVRELIDAIRPALSAAGHDLPIYWGNRNWHPMLADTIQTMRDDGVSRVLAFVTSAYSSNSGCRQYQDDIAKAIAATADPAADAPDFTVRKVRPFFNHPGFVHTMADNVEEALRSLRAEDRSGARIAFTAHSIPMGMAVGCDYEEQLIEVSRIIAERLDSSDHLDGPVPWDLVYQSRSGPPQVPWLEPDICDHVDALASGDETGPARPSAIVVAPIGFISDHMEVIWDLDTEAKARAEHHEIPFVRAATVGTHPDFVAAIVALLDEHLRGEQPQVVGKLEARPSPCAVGCCAYTPQRPAPTRPVA